MSEYEIKRGDLEPPMEFTLRQEDGTPIDVRGADSVKTIIRLTNASHIATIIVNRAATIVSATAGQGLHIWADGETDQAGGCEAEWQITWPTGRPQTVPSGTEFFTFTIHPDLAD